MPPSYSTSTDASAVNERVHRPQVCRKIILRSVSYFSAFKSVRHATIFTMQFTTTSPQNNHVQHPQFAKNPNKTPQSGNRTNSRSNGAKTA
jgi:hypothetical protein